MKNFIIIFSIFQTIFFNISFSQSGLEKDSTKIYKLDEVVVTATKTKTPISEISNSISLVDSSQIENSGKTSVEEILVGVPGISVVRQGGSGQLTSIFMRGSGSDQSLVLVDGVELNIPADPTNVYDFSNLKISDIEKIEVLRGPQSTLYGSNAMGGVIQIFTKKPSQNNRYSLNFEGGSNSTINGNLGFSGSLNHLSYIFDFSNYSTKGISAADKIFNNTEKDGSRNNSYLAKLQYELSSDFDLNLTTKFTKAKTDLDQTGGYMGDDPNYSSGLEESLLKFQINLNLFNGNWKQSISSSYLRNLRIYKDDFDSMHPFTASNARYDGNRVNFEWQNTIKVDDYNLMVIGLENHEEKAVSDYYSWSEYGIYNSIFPENSISTSGIYIQDQINSLNNLFITIGGRYDINKRFGSQFTHHLSAAYLIPSTSSKFKASYGTGFKAPSLFYLYDPAYGNTGLKPERNNGWEIGFEQYLINPMISVGITYFNNVFNDLFGFDPSSFKAINISKAETKGIEAECITKLYESFDINFNYTYTKTKDLSDNIDDKDRPLLRRPQNKLALIINYSF